MSGIRPSLEKTQDALNEKVDFDQYDTDISFLKNYVEALASAAKGDGKEFVPPPVQENSGISSKLANQLKEVLPAVELLRGEVDDL